MPLYDCMLMLKPQVSKEALIDLVARVGKHVYRKNGVLTDIKSYGTVNLGYGIKKLDGRYYQGKLMQMTMMTPPSMSKELLYLNKEDRLLRWLFVRSRNVKCGFEFLSEDDEKRELKMLRSTMYDDTDTEDDDDDEEYEVEQGDIKAE